MYDVLASDYGITLPPWSLGFPNGMSDDGSVIVGNGGDGWVVLLDLSCAADLDGDDDTDADDFFTYIDAFAGGDFDVCDIDNDGDCDVNDFFSYLDLFAQGC